MIYHKTEYRERRNHFAYFACSEPLAGFDTQREAFLGPYRGWDTPPAVERGRSANSDRARLGADRLAPRQAQPAARRDAHRSSSCWAITRIPTTRSSTRPDSQTINKRTVKPVIAHYLQPEARGRGLRRAARRTGTACWASSRCRRPTMHTNRMVNIWNAYQCMVTFNMSRSASLLRIGHRARHGLPRFEPGPAGLRAHDPGARPRAHPRPGRHAAARPAAHTTSTSR